MLEPMIENDQEPKDIRVFCLFSETQYDQMRELGKIYGFRYANEIISRAVREAMEHLDCPTPAELAALHEQADEAEADYTEAVRAGEGVAAKPGDVEIEPEEGEEEEGEEGQEEEPETLESAALEFAEKLDPKGKKFLAAQLSEPYSTRTRTPHLGGARPAWQDEIVNFVNHACGWEGRKSATRESTAAANQTRKTILAYLKEQGVL
jgi:hypothetical protein